MLWRVFNGTLYVIPRKTLKEFFTQAMIWNYGLTIALSRNPILRQEVTMKTYTGFIVRPLERKRYLQSFSRIIVEKLRSIVKNFDNAIKYCGVYMFLAPIVCIYRQLRYFRGIILVYNQLTTSPAQ